MKIIVAGTIGRSGLGGQAWASLQYLLGFRSLGHDVVYLEDCGQTSWVYDWEQERWTEELDYPAQYVQRSLQPFGLGDRWVYRDEQRQLGMPRPDFLEFCSAADLLLMRAVPLWRWREEYNLPKRRAFIDVDPGFTQISLATGDTGLAEAISHAEHCFSYGQHIGNSDCPLPATGGPWKKTRPPVYLPEWPWVEEDAQDISAILRWQGYKEVTYKGISLGQRDQSFPRFIDLPKRTGESFRIAQMGFQTDELLSHGWQVEKGEIVSRTPESYRHFIQQSRAELGIPKAGYLAVKGGWFSDRSVCYLASGRPVLMMDTGLTDWLPTGQGLLLFDGPEQAAEVVVKLNSSYESHRRAARLLAEDYFATSTVLRDLIATAME
jgi:hypothetical protein